MYETRALVWMGDRRRYRRDGALGDTYETGSMEWNDRRINIDTYKRLKIEIHYSIKKLALRIFD